jgi:hypothetical protein
VQDRAARTDIAQKDLDLRTQEYANPNAPRPKMITLTKPMFGWNKGDQVSSEELAAASRKYGADQYASGRAATDRLKGPIVAALDEHRKEIDRQTKQITAFAHNEAMKSAFVIKNASQMEPVAVKAALANLKLPPNFRYNPSLQKTVEMLNEAALTHEQNIKTNHYTALLAKHQPDIDRLTLRLNTLSGVGSDLPSDVPDVPDQPTTPTKPAPLVLPDMSQ